MRLLGRLDRGYTPAATDLALADGRVVGPFESEYFGRLFERYFGKATSRLFTAREIFEGSVVGEDYRIVIDDEFALETHPLREVFDIWIEPDNGKVVFDTETGFSVVAADSLVLVDSPERRPRSRQLGPVAKVPPVFDLGGDTEVVSTVKSAHRGEIVVAKTPDAYIVGWRSDGRRTVAIHGLSLHGHFATAKREAAAQTREFVPTAQQRKNRAPDAQRESLYRWEHSFGHDSRPLADIVEARQVADTICGDLGIPAVAVSFGRADLVNHSYYSGLKGVVLARDMLNLHTVVHEVAHHVTGNMRLPRQVAHGPRFAGVLLSLLERYAGASTEEALVTAVEYGVEVDTDIMARISERIAIRSVSGSAASGMTPSP